MDEQFQNISVLVRVRPLNSKELATGSQSCILTNPNYPSMIFLDTKPEQKQFNYDYISTQNESQESIFSIVGKPLSKICLQGVNCCIFAYGQTGAGKTYTMQGDLGTANQGLQPRVQEHLFELINYGQQFQRYDSVEWNIKCSYLEIYNEQIIDLLGPNRNHTLSVREDSKKGVYVENLYEETTTSYEQTLNLLQKGSQNRHTGSTLMNLESSRSHSIFTMSIESKVTRNGIIQSLKSKMNFVDLAGSERQNKTAAQGERLKEAGLINKSLTVLGLVINALVEYNQNSKRHIPYRDSKLTFILRESLGGNSKTFMIANISAATSQFQETLSTLKFAQRAKQIKNQATINEDVSGSVEVLKSEIRRLKGQLAEYVNIRQSVIINPSEQASQQDEQSLNTIIDEIVKKVENIKPSNIELEGDMILDKVEQWKRRIIQNVNDLRINKNEDLKRIEEEMSLKKKQNTQLIQEINKQILLCMKIKISVKKQKEEITQAFAKLDKQCKQLRQEKIQIQAQLFEVQKAKLSNSMTDQTLETEQQLRLELLQKQEALKSTIEQLAQLQNQLDFVQKLNDGLKQEVNLKTNQINELTNKLDGKQEELLRSEEDCQNQINVLEDTIQSMQEEIDTMCQSNQFQERELEKRQITIEEKIQENDQIQEEFQKLQYTNQTLLNQIQQKQSEMDKMIEREEETSRTIVEITKNNKHLTKRVAKQQQNIQKLLKCSDLKQKENQGLRQDQTKLEEQCKQILRDNNFLGNEMKKFQDVVESQNAKIDEQANQNQDLNSQLQERNYQYLQQETALKSLQMEICQQEQRQQAYLEAITQFKLDICQYALKEEGNQQQIKEQQGMILQQEKKIQSVGKQLEQKNQECESKDRDIKELTENKEVLVGKVQVLHQQSEQLREQCEKIKIQLEKTKEYNSAVENYQSLVTEFEEQQKQIVKFMQSYDIVNDKLTLKEKQCMKLQQEIKLELLQKERYLKEATELRTISNNQKREIDDLKQTVDQQSLEKKTYLEGEEKSLENDAKYKLLANTIRTLKGQNFIVTENNAKIQQDFKRLKDENNLLQRKLLDRYQLPSDLTKARKEIDQLTQMKEQLDVTNLFQQLKKKFQTENTQLKEQIQSINQEFYSLDLQKLFSTGQKQYVQKAQSQPDQKIKSYIQCLKEKENLLDAQINDLKLKQQAILIQNAEVDNLREENQILSKLIKRNEKSEKKAPNQTIDYSDYGDKVSKKLKIII